LANLLPPGDNSFKINNKELANSSIPNSSQSSQSQIPEFDHNGDWLNQLELAKPALANLRTRNNNNLSLISEGSAHELTGIKEKSHSDACDCYQYIGEVEITFPAEDIQREEATETVDRLAQKLLELGEQLRWPEVPYRPGHKLLAGEEMYRKFASSMSKDRISEVVACLSQRVGFSGHTDPDGSNVAEAE
jgi:hypothetical protein